MKPKKQEVALTPKAIELPRAPIDASAQREMRRLAAMGISHDQIAQQFRCLVVQVKSAIRQPEMVV